MNGGMCFGHDLNFTCQCPNGFSGMFCETESNECNSNPCFNGATCLDELNGYSCLCRPGYSGLHCDMQETQCKFRFLLNSQLKCTCFLGESNPCQNNGTCIDDISGFICQCLPGYSGLSCQTSM